MRNRNILSLWTGIVLFLLFLGNLPSVFAQAPANDSCGNAQLLTVNEAGSCGINATSGTTVDATAVGDLPSCDNQGTIQDVWYTFNSGTNTEIAINIDLGTTNVAAYEIFNACGTPNFSLFPSCSGEFGTGLQEVITGFPGVPTNYYIRVWVNTGFNPPDTAGTFDICLSEVPPANDLCANADTLTVSAAGACGANLKIGNTATASVEFAPPACDANGSHQDVWYVFNSGNNTSMLFNIQQGSASYVGFEIFDDCGLKDSLLTPTCVGGIDGQQFVTGFPGIPTSYYIRIWSNPGIGDIPGTFSICLEEPPTVPCGALQLSFDVSEVSTAGGSDGMIDLEVSGETGPYYYLWSNNAIAQDPGGLKAGSYSVTVYASGCFAVDSVVVTELPPQPDFCQDAVSLVVNPAGECPANSVTGTTKGATLSGAEPECEFPGGAPQDVWYTFNSGNSASIVFDVQLGSASFVGYEIFNTCGVVDTQLTPGCVAGIFGQQEVAGFPETPTDYYIRIWSNPGIGDTTGTFDICLSEAPPENDLCTTAEALTVHSSGDCPLNGTVGNTAGASIEGAEPGCDQAGAYQDVWYQFDPGTNTEIKLSINLGTTNITSFEIFDSCGIISQSVSPVCDLGIGSDLQQVITGFPGTSATYFIRVWANTGFGDIPGTFDICLSEPPSTVCDSLQLTFDPTDVSAPGGSNGSIDLTVSGETPPYSYLWSSGAVEEDLFDLNAGTYTVKVFAADCFVIDSVIVNESPTPGNDACINADALTINPTESCPASSITGTTAGATFGGGGKPVCDSLGTHQDVWYTFNSGNNTSIIFDIRLGTADYVGFELFDACGVKAASLSPGCQGGINGQQAVDGFPGTPTTYYVRVWSNPGIGDVPGTFDICLSEMCATQDIPLNTGWNMISSYIDPDNPDVLDVISDISTDVLIVKNATGQSAIPSFFINTIGDWNVEEGYKIKMANPATLTMECTQVDPLTTPISLPAGWSIISYLRDSALDVPTALNSITSDILIVKNASGNSYIPAFSINTIGDMIPGQGYQVKMLNEATLTYPANPKTSGSSYFSELRQPKHFMLPQVTGHNATIIIPARSLQGMSIGDEIGIFNEEGRLAGAAVYDGYNFAITAWGDDPTTEMIDGLELKDDFVFKVWSKMHRRELAVNVEYDKGETSYRTDGISIIKSLKANIPSARPTSSLSVYPNPSTGELNIALYLPANEHLQIRVMDVYGKVSLALEMADMKKGDHTVNADLSNLAAGLYLLEIKSNSLSETVKIQKH